MKLSILIILISAEFSALAQNENWAWSLGLNRDSLEVSLLKTNHDGHTVIQYSKAIDSIFGVNIKQLAWQPVEHQDKSGTIIVLDKQGQVVRSISSAQWIDRHGELLSQKAMISNPSGGFLWLRTMMRGRKLSCYALLFDSLLQVNDSIPFFEHKWPVSAQGELIFDYDWQGSKFWLAAAHIDTIADSVMILNYDLANGANAMNWAKTPFRYQLKELHFTYTKSNKYLAVDFDKWFDHGALIRINDHYTNTKVIDFEHFVFDDIAGTDQGFYLICNEWENGVRGFYFSLKKNQNRLVLSISDELEQLNAFELLALNSNDDKEYVKFSRNVNGDVCFGALSGPTSELRNFIRLNTYDSDFKPIDKSILGHRVLANKDMNFDFENYNHALMLSNCREDIKDVFAEAHFNHKLFDQVAINKPHSLIYGMYPKNMVVHKRYYCDSLAIEYLLFPHQKNLELNYPQGIFKNAQIFSITNNQYNLDSIRFSYTNMYGIQKKQSAEIDFIAKPKFELMLPDSTCMHQFVELKSSFVLDTIKNLAYEPFDLNIYLDTHLIESTQNMIHKQRFKKAGLYRVTANLNNGFCSQTINRDLPVLPASKASFRIGNGRRRQICVPGNYQIINRAEYAGEPIKTTYFLDDQELDGASIVAHDSMVGNSYLVHQLIEHRNGCQSRVKTEIDAYYGYTKDSILYPNMVKCTSSNKTYFEWDSLNMRMIEIAQDSNNGKFIYLNNFTDQESVADSSVTNYVFSYLDYCYRKSKPVHFTNLLLTYNYQDKMLHWNAPLGDQDFTYRLEFFDGMEWIVAQQSTEQFYLAKGQKLVYRVSAISTTIPTIFISNQIHLGHLYQFPTAFSPNVDGINDVLSFNTLQGADFEVIVFNKLGEILGRSNDALNIWDGTFNGKACPVGIYYYQCTIGDETLSGVIHLIR